MSVMLLGYYEVSDPDRFLEVFDGFAPSRARAGALTRGLLLSHEDPRRFVALIEFGSRADAEAFAGSAERLDALDRASVLERMDELLEVARPIAADAV